MNILWIEDFGGELDSGANTLNLMFGDLLSFESWNEDELSVLNRPIDLPDFCKQKSELNCIYLCRHYFDYQEFKGNCDFLKEIDLVIIDIRLSNNVSFDEPIPINSQDKEKFHNNAGFYIFNDLVHLGFPSEKMCFMTGEKNSLSDFESKCADIYIPKAAGFEKGDIGYQKLRNWIAECSSEYTVLRRGIIQGCTYLKGLPDEKIRFCDFSKELGRNVSSDEFRAYLELLENFLPIREPEIKETLYKLFIRTLAHEHEAADPELPSKNRQIKPTNPEFVELEREIKQSGRYAFSWILKMTRNWVSHNANAIFNQLTAEDLAYLFICSMRVIFDLGNKATDYENQLFTLLNKDEENIELSKKTITEKRVPLVRNYVNYFNESTKSNQVHSILNELQIDKKKLKDKGDLFFINGLYHSFWFLTSEQKDQRDRAEPNKNYPNQVYIKRFYTLNCFDYSQSEFLFKFSSHIYHRSFHQGEPT